MQYRRPEEFIGQQVVVVGGGNSGAQILAEVSAVTETVWVTDRPPRFLPDGVDGRALFAAATSRVEALRAGEDHPGVGGLGDIVMVPSVRDARDRGALEALPMFHRLTPTGVAWPDGTTRSTGVIVWCTGFRPALRPRGPCGFPRAPDLSGSSDQRALNPGTNRDCTWPATATGPVLLPPPSSGPGGPDARPHAS